MSESDPPQRPTGGEPNTAKHQPDAPSADRGGGRRQRWNRLRAFFQHVRGLGRDAASVAAGKLIESPDEPGEMKYESPGPAEKRAGSDWKVRMMHVAAERLRGAADSYIAAKLDEIEARVDTKLDDIEGRIDTKIAELHRHLREMRDRELRHRLRLLKLTLIFTVLVAALSLLYKWLAKYVFG
jgi:hypothetical protein